jgi:hypothetical protein
LPELGRTFGEIPVAELVEVPVAELVEVPGSALVEVHAPVQVSLHTHVTLAAYASAQRLARHSEPPRHIYTCSATSVAQAAALGLGLPALAQALTTLRLPLTSPQWQQIQAWHAQGHALQLSVRPLLQTTTPTLMAQLYAQPSLAALFASLLSPTTTTLAVDLPTARQALHNAGFALQVSPTATDLQPPATGALWLAAQLYQWLAEHLPLPLPPPSAAAQSLLAQFTPAQQALLHSQFAQLHAHLLDLLDGLPFTPPPQPSDPAQWQAPIARAIAEQHDLQIDYFSAGRNLLTRRLVRPYWLEDHHAVPYLRAYCHQSGQVLTFRLDRIFAIDPSPLTIQHSPLTIDH